MTARRLRVAAVGAAAVLVAACGDDGSDVPEALIATEENMAELQAGTLDLQLSAAAGQGEAATGPVGFRLEGPFSFATDTELAVFDLAYTRLLGDEQTVTDVRSTGDEAFVTVDGETYRVPDDEVGDLRLGDDPQSAFGDLGIAGWVVEPEVTEGDEVDGEATERITGEVDVADLLSDLARVAGPLMGDGELTPVEGDTGERLGELVRASSIEIVTTADDHRLLSLRAEMDFGADIPDELRESLASFAGARIEVLLSLVPGEEDLEVETPEEFVEVA